MCNSIHVLLLWLLFVVCFNSLTSTSSFPNWISIPLFSHYHHLINDSNINIIGILISNELPPGLSDFYFTSSFNQDEYHLKPGHGITFLSNFEAKYDYMVILNKRMNSQIKNITIVVICVNYMFTFKKTLSLLSLSVNCTKLSLVYLK